MKYFNCTEQPIEVYGLAYKGEQGRFWRLPENVIGTINEKVTNIAKRSSGGRIRFNTNSKKLQVEISLNTLMLHEYGSLLGTAGSDVYLGTGIDSKFIGSVSPENLAEENRIFKSEFFLSGKNQTVTINLPLHEIVKSVVIEIDDDADIMAPPEYLYNKPIVFYGSSITQGATASRPGCAYNSVVARWLDSDYINLGFSGNALGEQAIANYIAKIDMSAFVLDYDYNAPSVEHLEKTHYNFYSSIRKTKPTVPIVMISKPNFENNNDNIRRRNVIMSTYDNAISRGDKNVYFIDGESFFGNLGRNECTVDLIHPNDLGFMRMAEIVYPILKQILA